MLPLLWIAAGVGAAALWFALSCVVSLIALLYAVRHSNYRRPLEDVTLSAETAD
jgi:hypothetical protein